MFAVSLLKLHNTYMKMVRIFIKYEKNVLAPQAPSVTDEKVTVLRYLLKQQISLLYIQKQFYKIQLVYKGNCQETIDEGDAWPS